MSEKLCHVVKGFNLKYFYNIDSGLTADAGIQHERHFSSCFLFHRHSGSSWQVIPPLLLHFQTLTNLNDVSQFSFRNGSYYGRILQRQFHCLLCHHLRMGGRSVRCSMLSHNRHKTSLAQVKNYFSSYDQSDNIDPSTHLIRCQLLNIGPDGSNT